MSQWRIGPGAGSLRASGLGELRVLFPLSKLYLLDCTSVSCSAVFLLLAEAERGKAGSGNLTCICSVRISGICFQTRASLWSPEMCEL